VCGRGEYALRVGEGSGVHGEGMIDWLMQTLNVPVHSSDHRGQH